MTKSVIFSSSNNPVYFLEGDAISLDQHLVSQLFSAEAPDLGLLPPVVRYISPWISSLNAKTHSIAIVEQKPALKELTFNNADGFVKKVTVPIPWSYWIFQFYKDSQGRAVWSGAVSLWFSPSQAFDNSNGLYQCFLPNVATSAFLFEVPGINDYGQILTSLGVSPDGSTELKSIDILNYGKVCIGNGFWDTTVNEFSFADYLNQPLGLISYISFSTLFTDFTSYFWDAPFNQDYALGFVSFVDYVKTGLCKQWHDFNFAIGDSDVYSDHIDVLASLDLDQVHAFYKDLAPMVVLSDIIAICDNHAKMLDVYTLFQSLEEIAVKKSLDNKQAKKFLKKMEEAL